MGPDPGLPVVIVVVDRCCGWLKNTVATERAEGIVSGSRYAGGRGLVPADGSCEWSRPSQGTAGLTPVPDQINVAGSTRLATAEIDHLGRGAIT